MGMKRAVPTPEEFLAPYPHSVRALATDLRAFIHRQLPDVVERVYPGWNVIGYRVHADRQTRYLGYIAPTDDGGVALGFEWGALLEDPHGLLEGSGSQVRQIVFHKCAHADCHPIAELLQQAVEITTQPKELLRERLRQGN